jgi:hypothetical protein
VSGSAGNVDGSRLDQSRHGGAASGSAVSAGAVATVGGVVAFGSDLSQANDKATHNAALERFIEPIPPGDYQQNAGDWATLQPMIQRVVLCKLHPKFAGEVATVIGHTAEVLPRVPEVRGLEVGAPADPRSRREWDFVILVRFDDMAAVEAYRAHEIHRKYYEVFLEPMLDKIRVYNFSVPAVAAP